MDKRLGHYAFLLGIALAVLTGLVPQWQSSMMVWTLAVLGLLVGLLNINHTEEEKFLVSAIALMVVGSAGALPSLGLAVTSVLSNIVAFVGPAALVVALKAVWALAED